MTALGATALSLAAAVQGVLETRAAARPAAGPLLYLPSGRYLDAVSLSFDQVLADLVYLWSIQYYGNYAIADRYAYIDHIYRNVIAELDPHYLDPYLIGSLIMSVEARAPEMALRLLDKGMEANPGRWILPFQAAFVCITDLGDHGRAAGYFEAALRAPDVHPLVRRLHAEMYNRAGDPRTSLRLWAEIHESSEDEYVRRVAWNHVHDLRVRVDLEELRAALRAFRERAGGPPGRLEDLAAAALIRRVPRDPEGRRYLYDPVHGEVAYAGTPVLGR
jgi:hypothetical protein